LGKYVFSNKNELVILENIVHPIINQAQKLFIKNNKNDAVLFFDIPLLFEKKKYKNFDYIFYTFVEESVQKKRVLKRKEMTAKKFEKILKNQKHDLSKFRKYISLEINTIESKEEVKKKICIFLEKLNF
jgi:dephospho-CoA kinase